jgi:tetratricopeptide (TPR) repeat protein
MLPKNELSAHSDERVSGQEHEGYLGLLNDEALVGARAAAALFKAGVASRDDLLRANPSWLRVGTMRALLAYARHEFDNDPPLAHELTSFVLAHLDAVRAPSEETEFLLQQLRGIAYKEHGNALFMLTRLDDALRAAKKSVEIFSADPFHVVYRASAVVLVALITHALQRNEEAIGILEEAIPVFAEHSDAYGYIAAVQVRAMIALDEDEYAAASDLYAAARREAERIGDHREQIRIDHNLGLCALRLNELDDAREYMTRALLGFSSRRMDSELQRAIWLTAAIEKERQNLDVAMEILHDVYGRFLELGMVTEAARVLVELSDVITRLTGNVEPAQAMCASLAVTLGRYDVPAAVRAAIAHLGEQSAAARSVPALRALLHQVGSFLSAFLISPSAAFNPTSPE